MCAIVFFGVFYLNENVWKLPINSRLAGFIASVFFMLFVAYKAVESKKKFRSNIEHGSARWGTRKESRVYASKNPEDNLILTNTEFMTMNGRPDNPMHARNKHVLVVGSSGSGKTFYYAKPNLMQTDSTDFPTSVVMTDPKGDTVGQVGHLMLTKGYKLKIVNTKELSKSMKYNPLAYIRKEDDILSLVTILIANTSGKENAGKEDFWVQAEKMLYQALLAYIWYEYPEEEKNLYAMYQLIRLMEVREDDDTFENVVDLMFKELKHGKGYVVDEDTKRVIRNGENPQPDHFAVIQYDGYKLAAGKTAKSILISCATRLSPFAIESVRKMMEYDELELDKMGGYLGDLLPKKVQKTKIVIDKKTGKKKRVLLFNKGKPVMKLVRDKEGKVIYEHEVVKQKVAMFIIISDTNTTYNFIVALMYSQLFDLLCSVADNDFGGRLPIHVRFILDEFANIGLIPSFEQLIATIRSREMSVTVILQSIAQLKSLYKDNANTIIGNCDSKLFLGGSEEETLKNLSAMLGKETIDLINSSKSFGRERSSSSSDQKLGRELMTADEIGVMPNDKCILQIRGERPFYSDKYKTKSHKNYIYLSDYNEKYKLDAGKFVKDERIKKDKETDLPCKVMNKKIITRGEAQKENYFYIDVS